VGPPQDDLALAEVLLERAALGQAVLHLYSWDQPVLILGYGQDPPGVDLAACQALGVRVLRRVSGGTGVLHHRDLAVALALPASHPWAASIPGLYDHLVSALQAALETLGVPVQKGERDAVMAGPRSPICFEGHLGESLLWDGRKAVGCAQVRRARSSLVEAHLLLHDDVETAARCFGVPADRVRAAMAPLPAVDTWALGRAVTASLADALGLPAREVGPPHVPPGWMDRYLQARWAPVP
jgi:lipoate-protein ligase A